MVICLQIPTIFWMYGRITHLLNVHEVDRNMYSWAICTWAQFWGWNCYLEIEKVYMTSCWSFSDLIQVRGKTLHSEILKLIHSIRNKEELSQHWRESILVPIYKRGDKTDCSNYREIPVLPTTYKILPSILLLKLTLYEDEITADHQHGFWHNRSTTDWLFCICQMLE